MDTLRQDTLAYITTRPAMCRLDYTGAMLPHVVANVAEYEKGAGMVTPDKEAMRFYLADHLLAEIQRHYGRYEILPGDVAGLANDLYSKLASISKRLFSYLILICTRETRHVKKPSSWKAQHRKKHGDKLSSFLKDLGGLNSHEAVQKLFDQAPDVGLIPYAEHMDYVFWKGSFSSSFGGPAWGSISTCLKRIVAGEISLVLGADLGFALAHNGGPIFNKGRFYNHYSNAFTALLDVQRSGQIPQLLNSYVLGDPSVTGSFDLEELYYTYQLYCQKYPVIDKFMPTGHINWLDVRDCGPATTAWSISQTTQAHWLKSKGLAPNEGVSTWSEAKAAASATEWYEVMPNVKVAKLTRKQLAEAS